MKTTYKDLFELQRKLTSKGEVQILKKDCLQEFVKRVQADSELDLQEKALIIILANTGSRISEIVHEDGSFGGLKKQAFSENGFMTINVLKKRRDSYRDSKIHFGFETVLELMSHRKPQEFIIKMDRHQALAMMKRVFGQKMTCHSFRHSFVTALARKNWSTLRIAKLMNMNVNNVALYSQLDQKSELDTIFGEGAGNENVYEFQKDKKAA